MQRACLALVLALATSHARADVRVEILEGSIKDLTWDIDKTQITTTYAMPAFGFPNVPAKFNDHGRIVDRSSPFVVRATQTMTLPAGDYTFLVRSRNAARLYMDGKLVAENAFVKKGPDGHGKVPVVPKLEANVRPLTPGQHEKRAKRTLDGQPHEYRFEFVVGGQKFRFETGDAAAAVQLELGKPFLLIAEKPTFALGRIGWEKYADVARPHVAAIDAASRKTAGAAEDAYWAKRHDLARTLWQGQSTGTIDGFLAAKQREHGVTPAPLCDDEAYLRRVTLDTVGVVPSPEEIAAFRKLPAESRRAATIDRLLADERWADHWTSYWQDVLAENPGLLKPTLNNTGAFRYWIRRALAENLPMDRFATELTRMEGSALAGEPAGFAMASENDAPMAAKGQILAKAFLAADLTCARCHDAPNAPYKQEQLFALAAALDRKTLTLPKTSTVPVDEGGRVPAVRITLKPGAKIAPDWKLVSLAPADAPPELLRKADDSRERIAAILTNPKQERFAQVVVNRLWKRLMGVGLVDPVDNWHDVAPSHPELLTFLGRELMTHGYDLKHVARLILASDAYQRRVGPPAKNDATLYATQPRRRMTAEQVVDSLFAAAGKGFGCEELTFDPDGMQVISQCLNFGRPKRAWEFVALANERDRPALALPVAQTIVDVMIAYGWRESRTAPQTERDHEPMPLQSLTMAHGMLNNRIARACDDSAFTALALGDVELPELVERLYERVLSRKPTADETALGVGLLTDGFSNRKTGAKRLEHPRMTTPVAWSNHLNPEATKLILQMEKYARAGDPSSPRLRAEWRGRFEDFLWSLLASPEFVFVP